MYNAGEAAMGIKHLQLVKKPAAFQLGTNNPDDPKVQKMLGQLNSPNVAKMPAPMRLVIAQLAFANSDLAFQGNHLFQGNFYGVNIFDISNPAQSKLLTSLVCPGGQGDVSVYKNLLFMSVETAEWATGLRHAGLSSRSCAAGRRAKTQETSCAVSTERPFPRRENF